MGKDSSETLPEAGVWLYIMFAAGHNSKRVFYQVLKMLAMKRLNSFDCGSH